MEYILWNREEFDIVYNCTGINVNDIPIEQRRYPIAAIICIILGCIYYFNWSSLLFFTFLTYFVGCCGLFFWACECSADLILGINRCLEMAFPKIARKLFHNNRVYIWITFCTLHGLYWLLFCHPVIFSGILFEVSYEPLIGYIPFRMDLFERDIFEISIHNTILAIGSPLIYTLFGLCLYFKIKEMTTRVTKDEIMVFIQVFIISMLNTAEGLAYTYKFKYPDSGFWLTIIAHFSW
uniref:Uncharacterized protein n=1 Tax=Meloidogyne enterolobii TaxID=390850 RepID=A0A6V7UH64_MELEN|nr:unnamed protein product [Meloidogyne enterolobii]